MRVTYLCLFAISTLFISAGCPGPVQTNINNDFVKYLTKPEVGYTKLAIPSTLESGGSLVFIKTDGDKKMIEWVDDLIACGVPESVVFGKDETERVKNKNARFPSFTSSSKNDFGIGANFLVKGVGVDADAKIFRKIIMTVDSAGHEVIKKLSVANYLSDPLKRINMQDYCAKAIETQKVAVLWDVAFVEKGKLEFYKDDGLTLKAKGPEVINALNLDANARAKVSGDGTMTFNERVYVAFKDSFYVPDSGTLASSSNDLESATEDLKAASSGL